MPVHNSVAEPLFFILTSGGICLSLATASSGNHQSSARLAGWTRGVDALTRIARLLAAIVLGFLLISGIPNWLTNSLTGTRQSLALLGFIWLLPVAILAVMVLTSRTGRAVLGLIRKSRAHLAVAILAVLGFLFTMIPCKAFDRWMVTYVAIAGTAFMLFLAIASPILGPLPALLRRLGTVILYKLKPAAFLLLTSGLALVITNLISWLVFQHFPHVVDGIAQVFQGRIFASGRTFIPARFDNYFFSLSYVINDGTRVYAEYPFGHSLLLALGSLIHAEWLVNPLLGSAEVLVLYFLGKEVYDEKTGRIAALLGVASPFLLFMSSEFMNHASALLFLSLFLLLFFRTIRPFRAPCSSFIVHRSLFLAPVLCGFSLAMALNIRPLSALAVSIPSACYAIYLLLKWRGRPFPAFLALLFPVLLGLGAFGLYNYLTTGDPLLPGYKVFCMLDYGHAQWGLGFGTLGYAGRPPHTPWRGLVQTGDNLNYLNLSLFEGPFPGLLLVLLLLLAFTRKTADWLLLASFAALPAAYFFYWFQEFAYGPRLLYEGMAPLLLLSARGLIEFPGLVGRAAGTEAENRTRNLIAVGAAVSLAVIGMFGIPKLARQYGYRAYGVDNAAHARVTRQGITNAVVFLGPERTFYFGAGLLNNGLVFDGPVVYAKDRGPENYILMRQFPDRSYYYADPWTLIPIRNLDSLRNTPEIRDLEQAGAFVRQMGMAGYRTVLLPYREAGTFVDTGTTSCRTFRDVSYSMLWNRVKLAELLPAIAVFMPRDPRRYSPLLNPMREHRDFTADGCRFKLLFSADSGSSAVYDIRPAGIDSTSALPAKSSRR